MADSIWQTPVRLGLVALGAMVPAALLWRRRVQATHPLATPHNVLDSVTGMGLVTLGLDQVIRVFSPGAQLLLGWRAEEVLNTQRASVLFDPTELAALRHALESVLGHLPDDKAVFAHLVQNREEQEWSLVRQDGSRMSARLTFSPMLDAQGALQGHVMVFHDASKHQAHEAVQREAIRVAEQSSVAKGQFLASMSHEIRTPMNAILGMLQLLRTTALNRQQSDYTDKAVGAARSLLGLLNDILDFSKVEAGKMQLNPEPFALDSLLGELSVILSSNMGNKAVDMLFDVDPALPRQLVGDALRIKQILINLGGNAVKFTERGQVTVRCRQLARSGERVQMGVSVTDTGIGIAPENQARIFDGFTQAEASTTQRFGGTGLGLLISTRLVRLMGGELNLHSVLGQGSTFSFALELQAVEESVLPVAEATDTSVVHALVVDDNAQALAASAASLRKLGWQVAEAGSGAQALAWLQDGLDKPTGRVDVVFMDSEMPDMDGWDALRKVRRLYQDRALPFLILMSRQSREAMPQRSERELALHHGMLVKPLTTAMFVQALEHARGGPQLPLAAQDDLRRLQGMRVLLVEDNPINQQVAQELLHAQGARVTLADNGQQGLDALRGAEHAFDAVLMDLQMPVMDGLSATRALRADPRFAALPVIAMTADAMHADREACLAAGMNDHVGKPFDVRQLVQTLITHTRWSHRAKPGDAAMASEAPVADLPWPDALDVELALSRLGGGRALLAGAITGFVAEARHLPQRLEQACAAGDLPLLRRDLHAFKGLSATVGAPVLSALAARAEKLVQAPPDIPGYQLVQAQLQAQLLLHLPLLEQVAARLYQTATDPSPAGEPSRGSEPPQLQAPLQVLFEALQGQDMAALERYAALRQALDGTADEPLQALDRAMAELDFEAAAACCERLLRALDAPQPLTVP